MKPLLTTFFAASALLATTPAFAQLDSTFATNGVYTGTSGNGNNVINGAVRLSNGQFVTCGSANNESIAVLQRFDSTGTPDVTFGTSGAVNFAATYVAAWRKIVQQPDGKFVVAGHQRLGVTGLWRFLVARYNSDGTLDTGFGTNGVFSDTLTYGSQQSYALALQADGKIVVGGIANTKLAAGEAPRPVIFRLTTAGALDASFNSTGSLFLADTTSTWAAPLRALSVANGKIYAGYSTSYGFKIACIDANGSFSSSFNGGSPVQVDITTVYNEDPYDLLVEADGRVVVAGTLGQYGAYVARIKADGTGLDPQFATAPFSSGVTTTRFGSPNFFNVAATSIHKRADGHYWVTAYADLTNGQTDLCVMMLTPEGHPLSYFGTTGGYYTHSVSAGDDRPYCSVSWSNQLVSFGTAGGYNVIAKYKRGYINTAIEAPAFAANIYPNPAREVLHITADQPLTGELLSLTGAVVAPYDGTGTLNISQLPAGIYLLRLVNTQGETSHLRVVIE